jgi:hypothetical protein
LVVYTELPGATQILALYFNARVFLDDRSGETVVMASAKAYRSPLQAGVAAIVLGIASSTAWAGPPFLTDDPEPLALHHSEFYIFAARDKTAAADSVTGPAIEYNYEPSKNVMLHMVVPYAMVTPSAGPIEHGLGDMEFGFKYRFVQETGSLPEIGIFPAVEVPTGDATKGLGNGRTWYRLPLWLQKSWGSWTSYGGGGYAINNAAGQKNYWFGGWEIQRDLSNKLTLGGELYVQGADTVDSRSTTIANLGGYWNFTPGFSLLFSGGHSISGESHSVAYLALYWTWGPTSG